MSQSTRERDIASIIHPFTNPVAHQQQGPLVIESGKGVWVYDESGKAYIEGASGLWCASLGFGEERLIEASNRQMRKLPFMHLFGSRSTSPAIELSERLLALAPVPMSKVFFANSGSEAVDTVVKMVWFYNNARGLTAKKKIIAREDGFHGSTVAAASLTGIRRNHRQFDLPIANIIHAARPHYYHDALAGESEEAFSSRMAESLDRQIVDEGPETVAAFIAEPIMGAGGVLLPPAGYFEKIQKVVQKYDLLFIADEVICGFGRTGNLWGSETFGLRPDMMTSAKQLSSAYAPISAVLVNEKVYEVLARGSDEIGTFAHGFTYGRSVTATDLIQLYPIAAFFTFGVGPGGFGRSPQPSRTSISSTNSSLPNGRPEYVARLNSSSRRPADSVRNRPAQSAAKPALSHAHGSIRRSSTAFPQCAAALDHG